MKTNRNLFVRTLLNWLLLLAIFSVSILPVAADGGDDDDSVWDGVIDENGEILYDNLIDQGIHQESVDWMPSIDILGNTIGGTAEYHIYETADGTVVKLPTASTLFFMALNPGESGIGDASASHFTGAGTLLSMPGVISALLQGADIDFSNTEYVSSDQYADALLAGETDIWSLGVNDLWGLMTSLGEASYGDLLNGGEFNLYTAMLLYTPDNIPLEILELLPPDFEFPPEPPEPPACPAPSTVVGEITRSGTIIAPNFPLVVGQDPDKRGVDLSFNVSVAPTIYTYYELVPVVEESMCGNCNGNNPSGPACHPCDIIVDWVCEQRTQSYSETIPVAYGSTSLTKESEDWILNTLSIRYPGAYIHNGSFRFPSSSGGSSWNYTAPGIQIADPGEWTISIGGRTSGTPVSAARNFGGPAGSFEAWLKETAITQ